ncbi:MAG: saccharopine dehydrogenase family protein [Gemmatimonadaceae bacterium]
MDRAGDGHRVLLLGLGAQGKAALHDLLTGDDTTQIVAADSDPGLDAYVACYPAGRVSAARLDAGDDARVAALMRDADVVVEALPGPFALRMGRLAAQCGVGLVSSMYYRDPQETDARVIEETEREIATVDHAARDQGVVILTEFGLDPGLDLMLGAEALCGFDEVHEFLAYGAGIPGPNARGNPLDYKFSWSAMGVMRSYRRPARVITKGTVEEIDATRLFEPGRYHLLEVDGIGAPLECYPNGDAVHYATLFGLRGTVREMARYTGRLPGHCAFWDVMVKSGFLDHAPVRVGGVEVSPIEFTASLLAAQRQFQYTGDEQDLAFIRVDVRGLRAGERRRVVCDVVDRRDPATGFTAMQRTVGFTLAIGARLILDGALRTPGLLTPLAVPYQQVFPALARRGVQVQRRDLPWP